MFKKIFAILLLIGISLNQVLASEVRIVIDQGVDNARPVVVLPFEYSAGGKDLGADFAKIIADDLRNSGKFSIIRDQQALNILSPNSNVDLSLIDSIKFDAEVAVKGKVKPLGNSFEFSYQLIDLQGILGAKGSVVLDKTIMDIESKWFRFAAHTISDEIFEKLTAVKGAFRTKIAYVLQRNIGSRPFELYVADYDGFNSRLIAKSSEPIMSPAWSADGKQIAYTSFENKKSQLMLQNLASGKRKVLVSFKRHNGAPAFSPDGTKLVFASSRYGLLDLYQMTLADGKIEPLTKAAGNNTEPSFSPDSQKIVFTSDRYGRPQVFSMDLNSKEVEQVGLSGSSYSGKYIDNDNIIMIEDEHIVKLNLLSFLKEVLSVTYLDESPSISPNGIMVMYSSTQGLTKVLQLVSSDGRFKARLPGNGGQFKFPAWSPYLNK